jgi:hypothetical protein
MICQLMVLHGHNYGSDGLDMKDKTVRASNRCSAPLQNVDERCPSVQDRQVSELRTAEFDRASLLNIKQTERHIVILIYYCGLGRRMECLMVRGELNKTGDLGGALSGI